MDYGEKHYFDFMKCNTIFFKTLTRTTQNRRFLKIQTDVAYINPRTYKQTHTPTVVQGRGGGGLQEPLPWVFVGLRYFEKVIPPIDSLLCRLHD